MCLNGWRFYIIQYTVCLTNQLCTIQATNGPIPSLGPWSVCPPPPPPSNGTVLTGISVIFGCEIMLTHKSSMPGVAVSVSTQTHTFAYFLTQVLGYCPDNSFLVFVDSGCHWLNSRTWWKTDKNIWKHLYSYAVLHYSLSHHVNNNTELT